MIVDLFKEGVVADSERPDRGIHDEVSMHEACNI